MNDYKEEIEAFKEFASDALKTHQGELDTRYQNEKIDKDTLEKGYEEHRRIFDSELKERADTLLSGSENPGLKEQLNEIRDRFIQQLSLKN